MRQIYLAAMLCGLSLVALPSVVPSMAAEDAAKPVRKWVVYLLPHSHVDIGYTDIQPEVERVHREILAKALDLCRKTADYPLGSRFKWNSEVAWPVDSYLRHVSAEKQQQLVDAVRAGQVELHALYANELAGLCRPEELLRLMQRGTAIGRRCGVTVEAAMITDTPGCPWGMVPAMAQAGVKYKALAIHQASGEALVCLDYLDGKVKIDGASYSRRVVVLAIEDLKQKIEAPLPLRSEAYALMKLLRLDPIPELTLYRDLATAILRIDAALHLTKISRARDLILRRPVYH